MAEVVLNEKVLDDDYPVYFNYLYVADGKVVRSDIEGTIKNLKKDLKVTYGIDAKVITSCDIFGRQELQKQKENK